MSEHSVGQLILFILVILASAHLFGSLFSRLRQPRVIGEILGGLLVGPSLLNLSAGTQAALTKPALDVLYWIGLLMLMFLSGAETQGLFHREERKPVAWIGIVGTGLPFIIALLLSMRFKLTGLLGSAQNRTALILVIGIGTAVTSIPVISRIFHDLRILHTRFAKLILGVAVMEDVVLWAVLAVATALAESKALPTHVIAQRIALTLLYFVAGLVLFPRLARRLHAAKWNVFARHSMTAYLIILLFAYVGLAAAMNVSLVLAAFLAGFAVPHESLAARQSLGEVKGVAFGCFVPVYFALVGYKLDLGKTFDLRMVTLFLVAACAIKLLSVLAGAKLAGFSIPSCMNLAVATNARGGPGIVLASVAFEAGIINAAFYTTLILLAVITSQAAGAWLEHVLRSGKPLLTEESQDVAVAEALAA
ncbi:MAG: cation:proton antiporter [Acidobacteria bacterium]|nr:cation:proton antiporter [Acidobacteriota bacterium]MBV9144747.1 cation:proton antiporter [Acidobacteriota bacterium]MBV9437047.1 cation:proton antiporter [Acidobacteriota bacterium]